MRLTRILLALALTAICVIGAGLALRSYRQHKIEQSVALHGPDSIREGRYVVIGSVPQWISIRGEHRTNPVILFVHGGPGDAQSGLAANYRGWERDFTVVQWDQRGGGLTFAAGARLTPKISLDRMVADGIEVTEYIRRRLDVHRVILVGHSWGSVLGVHMVKARPDLFSAYVGTGQVVDSADTIKTMYSDTMSRAQAAHEEKTVRTLEAIGHPPYAKHSDFVTIVSLRNHYLAPPDLHYVRELSSSSELGRIINSPDLSLTQAIESIHGTMLTAGNLNFMFPPLDHANLPALGYAFPIPFFLFEGDADRVTYTSLAEAYYERIEAPHKEIALLPGGHFVAMTNPDAFRDALVSRVRPFAIGDR